MEVNVLFFITKIWLSCTVGSHNAKPTEVIANQTNSSHIFNIEWMKAPFRRREHLAARFKQSRPNLKIGPERTWKYDPNWGYEPYWEGGDWVFDDASLNASLCMDICYPEYKKEGWVCGRNFKYEHKSFETYCDLKNADCLGKIGWMFAYRGQCRSPVITVPTSGLQIRKDVPLIKEKFLLKLPSYQPPPQPSKPKDVYNVDWFNTCNGQPMRMRPRYYNPNHGYQPYWPGGDWILQPNTTTTVAVKGTTAKTTTVSLVCGEECDEVYHQVGPICTRSVSDLDFSNIGCIDYNVKCPGRPADQYRVGYKQFDDYCAFLNSECSESINKAPYMQKYIYVHPGTCFVNFTKVFRPFELLGNDDTDVGVRKKRFLTELCRTYAKNHLNTTPCIVG